MTIQVPYVISSLQTTIEQWKVIVYPLSAASANGAWSTAFVWVVLVISVILLFRLIAGQRRSELHLKQEITKLTDINIELRQDIDKLHHEQVEILEDIIDADPPGKEIQGFNPQEMKALSELAKRLQ
jgi:hypothetical protein